MSSNRMYLDFGSSPDTRNFICGNICLDVQHTKKEIIIIQRPIFMGMKSNFDNRTASRLFCCAQTDDPRNPLVLHLLTSPPHFCQSYSKNQASRLLIPFEWLNRGEHTHTFGPLLCTPTTVKNMSKRAFVRLLPRNKRGAHLQWGDEKDAAHERETSQRWH